jgi:short-subunit dehydrogenase
MSCHTRFAYACLMSAINDPTHEAASAAPAAQRSVQKILGAVWRNPATILITGATGGIGAALALSYARPGRTLILHGRNEVRLAGLCGDCEAAGARILALRFDVRDALATQQELRALSQREVIDLAVVNAGVTGAIGKGEQVEQWEIAHQILAVNLDGALATVAGVLPAMRQRGSGQIALVSSLAAYVGIPLTPAYCASKAALKAYGEALRGWLAPQGVAVNVVLPGFVETPMTDGFKGPKPGLMSAERAARIIRRGLERNRARIAFPLGMALGAKFLTLLPLAVATRLLQAHVPEE